MEIAHQGNLPPVVLNVILERAGTLEPWYSKYPSLKVESCQQLHVTVTTYNVTELYLGVGTVSDISL